MHAILAAPRVLPQTPGRRNGVRHSRAAAVWTGWDVSPRKNLLAFARAVGMMVCVMADDHDDDKAPVSGGAAEPRQRSQEQSARPPEDDPMGPPAEPCECWCMHCHRTFMSDGIWFQRVVGDPDGFGGFWMCPTPNCSGAGFTFDIFPTDPDHPANEGWHSFDDDDDDEDFEGEDDDDEEAAEIAREWQAEDEADAGEWDPEEGKH